MSTRHPRASDAQFRLNDVTPLTDAEAAHQYRLAQARALIEATIPVKPRLTATQTGVTVEDRPWSAVSHTTEGDEVIRGTLFIRTTHYRLG